MFTLAFTLELTRPLVLAALLVLLPVLAWYFVRSLVDYARWQRALSLAVRCLIVALIVLSLAGLVLLRPTKQQYVVFALDRSVSIGENGRKQAEQFIADAVKSLGSNRAALLEFAAEPGVVKNVESGTVNVERVGGPDTPNPKSEVRNPKSNEATHLAAAIELAAASIPPSYVPHVVLLTDGNETTGDALAAAASSGLRISTLPLPTRSDPEVQVTSIDGPATVRQGEPFYLDVLIDSNLDGEGSVEVFQGPHRIAQQKVALKKGENKLRFRQSVGKDKLAEFSVRAVGYTDTLLDNNEAKAIVFAAGKPRVLLIESQPKSARHLVWALGEEDIEVDVRPPTGMPSSLADLQNYEMVILSDVPATALTLQQMEVARAYVQDLGGGFMMLGGEQSFGLGGYYKTVIEEILPVRSDFEKEKQQPSLAMAIVIDKSGSMGGMKIELAKEAAKSAVELLGPRDQVAIIAFDGETYSVCEMHSASDKGYVLDRISSITADGGTVMAPAMEKAYNDLLATSAKLKHAIILTDGISAPGDFEGITSNMAAARMTVSTVGVGEGCDTAMLEKIAQIGRGRYHFADDPSSVPQIFAKETMTASKSAINEEPFQPQVVRASAPLAGIGLDSAPFLMGYVRTRPKPTSEFVLATEAGDPLLAWWRFGLGMTVAFTSDAKSRWAAEWVTWPEFSKFWAQVVRHAMRRSDAQGLALDIGRRGNTASVTLDAVGPDSNYLNGLDSELTVISPTLDRKPVTMKQTAPGRYEARFDAAERGVYHVEMTQKRQGALVNQQSRGLVVGYPDELRLRDTNEKLLQTIAESTGGVFKPEPSAVFAPTDRTARDAMQLWPWLAAAALLLFVLDVALRRIDFDLYLSRPVAAGVKAKPSPETLQKTAA